MPRRSRYLEPGRAPARVLKFLKRNPGMHAAEIGRALGIKFSTVAMAMTRLVQLGMYERPPHAVRQAKPGKSAPSPTESLRRAREQFSAAAGLGPTLLPESEPVVHPTGTPYVVLDGVIRASSGAVQAFTNVGAAAKSAEYSHQGTVNVPHSNHPWNFGTKVR